MTAVDLLWEAWWALVCAAAITITNIAHGRWTA